jgi:hypothetical protein
MRARRLTDYFCAVLQPAFLLGARNQKRSIFTRTTCGFA